MAALPAGLLVLAALWGAIQFLFPLTERERAGIPRHALDAQLEILGPLTRQEWISLAVLGVALLGWVGKPLHGIAEAWVTLGAFLAFLLTGVLDRQGLRSGIDWGFLLFFGVISSLAVMVPHLKVDRWLIDLLGPAFSRVASRPLPFLISALLLAYAVRLLLNKFPTLILLSLALMPWAQALGIHPGVLLLTLLIASECWFFPYQDTNYQIVYYSTHEKAFTHAQGRRLMVAKLAVSLVAVALSVPYWRVLGLIR